MRSSRCGVVAFCLLLGNCHHRRYFCAGVEGAMAAGDRTQNSAGVAAQTTGVWHVLWLPDCILALLSLPKLVGLKLEWVYFQTLQHSLHTALQTDTHTRARTHTHTCMHTYIDRVWNHPPLPGPLLRWCSQCSLLLLTALHIQAECHTPAASYTQADLMMQ